MINLGKKIDKAIEINNHNLLNGLKNQIKAKLGTDICNEVKSTLYHYIGNIFYHQKLQEVNKVRNIADDKNKTREEKDGHIKKNKIQEYKKESIKSYLLAIEFAPNRTCLPSIYTNLGNHLYQDSRYIEAIHYYQKSQNITNKFLLPVGMKVGALNVVSNAFYEKNVELHYRHLEMRRILLLELTEIKIEDYSIDEIEQIEGKKIIEDYKKEWGQYFDSYYAKYNHQNDTNESIEDSIMEEECVELKTDYILWCRDNSFLLSLLSLVRSNNMLQDDFMPSKLSINRGDFILSFWQQVSQEYCSSRYVFYKYKDYDSDIIENKHHSDKNNFITQSGSFGYKMIDDDGGIKTPLKKYEDSNFCLGHEIEEIKSAYVKLYNLLDKIAVLLITYIKEIDVKNISKGNYIKDIQEDVKIIDKKISLASFGLLDLYNIKDKNPFLYSFLSIYNEVVVEDIYDIKIIRDKITHGFLKVTHSANYFRDEDVSDSLKSNFKEISLGKLRENFEFLLQFVRSQFFYSALCIKNIEKSVSFSPL